MIFPGIIENIINVLALNHSIYNLYEGELKEILNGLKLFPIGMNPSGDLICLKYEDDNSICLFRQESRNVEYIADSISDFEKSFY